MVTRQRSSMRCDCDLGPKEEEKKTSHTRKPLFALRSSPSDLCPLSFLTPHFVDVFLFFSPPTLTLSTFFFFPSFFPLTSHMCPSAPSRFYSFGARRCPLQLSPGALAVAPGDSKANCEMRTFAREKKIERGGACIHFVFSSPLTLFRN